MLRCDVFRRQQAALVVHSSVQPAEIAPAVVHASRHGKYADAEKRKAYRREWMRAKRARQEAARCLAQ